MHTRTHVIYIGGSYSWPSDVHSLIVTHTRPEIHVRLPPGFCSERGLEGKPQHSSEERQGRGKSLSHISQLCRDCFFMHNTIAPTLVLFYCSRRKDSCHFGLKQRQQVRQHGAVRPGRGHNERWESVKSDYT